MYMCDTRNTEHCDSCLKKKQKNCKVWLFLLLTNEPDWLKELSIFTLQIEYLLRHDLLSLVNVLKSFAKISNHIQGKIWK